ncbi:TadE/TadG family type IV pilus assembly protein [Rhizobium sp. PAMB 3174]
MQKEWQLVEQCSAALPRLRQALKRFSSDRAGNFAVTFALIAVPLSMTVGSSFDFAEAYNTREKMQADLDAALLAGVRDIGTATDAEIKDKIRKWFAAQTPLTNADSSVDPTADVNATASSNIGTYQLTDDDITIDHTTHEIKATVRGTIGTTLLRIVGVDDIDVSITAAAAGSTTSFIDVYIVLDKSSSMLLAATTADQQLMVDKTSCVFACHSGSIAVASGSGRKKTYTYYTPYEMARLNNVTLRSDVQLDAVRSVLDMVDAANTETQHIRVGFYTVGTSTTGSSLFSSSYNTANGLHAIQAPTYDTAALRSSLTNNSALNSDSTYDSSDFRALKSLSTAVGTAGDGLTQDSAKKLVMLITDGAQSSKGFITSSSYYPDISPLNPKWCDNAKNAKATMAVLYTEYLAVSIGDDVYRYQSTLGSTMSSSYFTSVWGGTLSSTDNGTSRRDYISKALSACASNSSYFIAAEDKDEIVSGFSALFDTYLSNIRLTQ